MRGVRQGIRVSVVVQLVCFGWRGVWKFESDERTSSFAESDDNGVDHFHNGAFLDVFSLVIERFTNYSE